jgi:glycosyltransferase involved in cell wall biosynthesis
MSPFNLSIIIPVLNRPKNISPLLNSLFNTTPMDKVDILFVTNQSCVEEINEINKFTGPITVGIAPDSVMSWAKRINWGVDYSKINNRFGVPSTWILCAADDILFHDKWFEIAEAAAENFSGILGTNDLGHPATIGGWHSTHPLVNRNYIELYGVIDEPGKLCHEGYSHNYVDVEFIHTAMKRSAWKHEPKCIIEHNHPAWNKAEWDDVYQKGQENVSADSKLWTKRKLKFNL